MLYYQARCDPSSLQCRNIRQHIQTSARAIRPRNYGPGHQRTLHASHIQGFSIGGAGAGLCRVRVGSICGGRIQRRFIGAIFRLAAVPARGSRESGFPYSGGRGEGFGGGGILVARGAVLDLVVRLEMLLHVVCTGEFLLAALVGAVDCLLRRVDLGVPGGVAGRREGLLAVVRVSEAAGVPFGSSLGAGLLAAGFLFILRVSVRRLPALCVRGSHWHGVLLVGGVGILVMALFVVRCGVLEISCAGVG